MNQFKTKDFSRTYEIFTNNFDTVEIRMKYVFNPKKAELTLTDVNHIESILDQMLLDDSKKMSLLFKTKELTFDFKERRIAKVALVQNKGVDTAFLKELDMWSRVGN